ncbi:MAG: DUF6327 family protein [Flavobacteriaceae bacterium]
MERKRYSSYKEIDRDLKILKLEKELQYQKLLKSGREIKESLSFVSVLPDLAIGAVNTFSGGIKGAVLGYLLKIIFKRK